MVFVLPVRYVFDDDVLGPEARDEALHVLDGALHGAVHAADRAAGGAHFGIQVRVDERRASGLAEVGDAAQIDGTFEPTRFERKVHVSRALLLRYLNGTRPVGAFVEVHVEATFIEKMGRFVGIVERQFHVGWLVVGSGFSVSGFALV